MFRKLLTWGVRGFIAGPGKSWVYTSGALMVLRALQSKTAKSDVVDVSRSKPGDMILIEHLDITHAEQIKEAKTEKKASKRAARDAKRLARKS